MIPIRDSQWRRSTPYVTRGIIIINVLVFLVMLMMDDSATAGVVIADSNAIRDGNLSGGDFVLYPISDLDAFTLKYGAVPEFITGYLDGDNASHDFVETTRVAGGVPRSGKGIDLLDGVLLLLTPLTAMFLHGGWLHLGGNMLFLWVFGDNVEDRMGHVRFALFYAVTGYAAVAAHIWIDTGDLLPLIGASGAISGVLGAYLLLFPRAVVQVLIPVIFFIPAVIPAPVMIGVWFVFNLISGVGEVARETTGSGGTAWFAHVGGFVAGMVLVYPFLVGRWRAPVGEIGPQWNIPRGAPPRLPGLRMPRRPRRSREPEAESAADEAERIVRDAAVRPELDHPWKDAPPPRAGPASPRRRRGFLARLLSGRLRPRLRRSKSGGVDIYREFPRGRD